MDAAAGSVTPRSRPSWRTRALLLSLALHAAGLCVAAVFIRIQGRPAQTEFVAQAMISASTELDEVPPVPDEPFEMPARSEDEPPPVPDDPPHAWDVVTEPDDAPPEPGTIVVRTPFASSARYRQPRPRPPPAPPSPPAAGSAPRASAAPPAVAPPAPPPRMERTTAALVRYTPPDYPESARSRGVEGSVGIEVTVLADGTVADVAVVRSSGAAVLDRAAVRAVRAWTFRPATVNGEPVESVLRLPPIRFRLTD